MLKFEGPFRLGAIFITLSGLIHIIAPLFSGFAMGSLILVPAGILYVLLGRGLSNGYRWLAYIVFFLMMAGSVIALSGAWTTPGVPTWIPLSIVVLDWLTILALFVALWRKPAVTADA